MVSTGKRAFILHMKWTQAHEKMNLQWAKMHVDPLGIFWFYYDKTIGKLRDQVEHQKKDEQWDGLCLREFAEEIKAFVVSRDG